MTIPPEAITASVGGETVHTGVIAGTATVFYGEAGVAYRHGLADGAAAERDRWRPVIKRIYGAAIEGGQSATEVRHRIINILDDVGAFGDGPFADLIGGSQ